MGPPPHLTTTVLTPASQDVQPPPSHFFISQAEIDCIVARAVAQATKETTDLFQRKMAEMEERHQQHFKELEASLRTQEKHNNHLEQYSRRSHLRIWGLQVKPGESCKSAVAAFVGQLKDARNNPILCTEEDIDAAHPLPTRSQTRRQTRQSSAASTDSCTIVRFHRRDLRDSILKARRQLKGKGQAVNEDLTSKNFTLLRKLSADDSIDSAWSWNGKIYAKDKRRQLVKRYDIHDL